MIETKEGFDYQFNSSACAQCGAKCCSGERGYIWVNRAEIEAIACFLKMPTKRFMDEYLRKEGYKFSIKELKLKEGFVCAFLENHQCSIYEVRPKQCRTFPFWDYFKTNIEEVKAECIGILD